MIRLPGAKQRRAPHLGTQLTHRAPDYGIPARQPQLQPRSPPCSLKAQPLGGGQGQHFLSRKKKEGKKHLEEKQQVYEEICRKTGTLYHSGGREGGPAESQRQHRRWPAGAGWTRPVRGAAGGTFLEWTVGNKLVLP